ncbi:MAG: type II toxin-antitoxin system RelE/ParE family toxin [Candidatus Muiribacteriota bacterium]
MKNFKIIFSSKAEADLTDIIEYISGELKQPLTANKLLNLFKKQISTLSFMPERNKKLKFTLHSFNIRYLPVKNYLVFYIIDDLNKNIVIIRVLHKKRNWEYLL